MKKTDYVKQPQNRASAVLTTSYVAGLTIDRAYKYNQLVIYINFTKGSTTSMEWKVEFSQDNVIWNQEVIEEYIGNGISKAKDHEHRILSSEQSAAAKQYKFEIGITDRYIRISAKGTGVMTSSLCAIDVSLGIN